MIVSLSFLMREAGLTATIESRKLLTGGEAQVTQDDRGILVAIDEGHWDSIDAIVELQVG